MKALCLLLGLAGLASAGTLYVAAYPDQILVVDEANGKVLDKITMVTGLPSSLRLSQDKKSLVVFTNDHAGIEIVDIATRKVTNHFVLDDATHRYRVSGGAPDPETKLLYTTTTLITKQIDRFEIGKPKYTVIDLAQQKIVKTLDVPNAGGEGGGDDVITGGGRGGGGFEVSPDGKFLYQFGNQLTVLRSSDFGLVERIPLSRPEDPSMQGMSLGGLQEGLSEPGQRVSLFNSSDPIVHNRVFGLAKFDLNTRKFDFTPIGPSPVAMTGLRITPDKKTGYTVVTNGSGGNKRCEVWAIDVATSKLARTSDIPCRSRFSFGTSSDGKKVYMYGAGFEIDVYDTVTFKHEATWDLGHDMRNMVALP